MGNNKPTPFREGETYLLLGIITITREHIRINKTRYTVNPEATNLLSRTGHQTHISVLTVVRKVTGPTPVIHPHSAPTIGHVHTYVRADCVPFPDQVNQTYQLLQERQTRRYFLRKSSKRLDIVILQTKYS